MPIYAVISTADPEGQALDEQIRSRFKENDRHEHRPGVWFIQSPVSTTTQLRDELGINVKGPSGIVIATTRYTGVADEALVEKLQVWGGTE